MTAHHIPPPHIVYWNGNTYKSLQTLVNKISADEYYLFEHRVGRQGVNMAGPMAVYFQDQAMIDLTPIVEPVLIEFKDSRPHRVTSWRPTAEEKLALTAWRKKLREALRVELELAVPVPYRA